MTRGSIAIIITAMLFGTMLFAKDPLSKYELPNGMGKNATLKLADRYYAESIFYSAAENYKLYLTKKPTDRYANYWLAMALYQARDYAGSEKAFYTFYTLVPDGKKQTASKWEKQNREFFKLGHLYYGMALHRNGNYEKAKQELDLFKHDFYSNDQDEVNALNVLAALEITGCDSSLQFKKQKVKVKKMEGPINNPYTQAAPFLLNDKELYYTSLEENSLVKYTDIKNKKYSYIYKTQIGSSPWVAAGKGTKIQGLTDEDKYFQGNGSFNADGSRFYFTKCLERDDDRSLCNIFVSDVKGGKIGESKRLPEGINFEEKYTATQPTVRTIDAKQEIIYYVSDMPGGKGGLDIWYTKRNSKGEFSEPRPLNGVNSVGDEVTPFFNDSTKTLYFSSDGLPGLGGFDVFKSTEKDKSFSEPRNMGKPINSGADDLYFSRSKDQTHGYMASNREGSTPLAGISTASDDIFYWENLHYGVDGSVKKKNDPNADMTNAKFNLYRTTPEGEKQLIAVDSAKRGNYFFNLNPDEDYIVEVEKPGFISTYEPVTTRGLDDEDTINKNFQVAKDAFVVYGKVIEDDSLTQHGIYQASVLIYEIKEGREYLFREFVAQDSFYYTMLPTERDFKILARKEGYFAGNTKVSTKNLPQTLDSLRADVKLKKVIINKEYRLSNILYEFDKATLTQSSKAVLDTLYDIMHENPSFVIELASHTDGKGNDPYNMRLSQARAQSCVDYLIKRGIEKKRMIPMGYGMRKPIAPNKNEDGSDNPDGRAINRRTEFKILKG
jgi:outer membrane protein OmpA-like peptidoglycan-associated protein